MAISNKSAKKPSKAVKKAKPAAKKASKATATKKKTIKPAAKKVTKSAPVKKTVKTVTKKKLSESKKIVPPKPVQESIPPQPASQSAERNETQKEPKKGADKYSIDVLEGPDNRYFVLTVNNYRNFFALEEMRNIVKACHQASGEEEGMQRLYHWFRNFRQDVITNTKIEGPSDPALKTIYDYIVSTYTVKGS